MPDSVHYQDDKGDLDVPTGALPGEDGTPSQPPDEPDDDTVPPDHPELDTNIDSHELYDEGRAGAAGTLDQEVKDARDERRIA